MLTFARNFCFAAAGAFFVMALIGLAAPCAQEPVNAVPEKFDPALTSVASLDDAEKFIRSGLPRNATPVQIADAIEAFVAKRFRHGYSTYSMCDNWLAYLAGGFRFSLRVPIDADDVLKHDVAMCTQSTTVIQALLERFGIPHASLRFGNDSHIAPVAKMGTRWALYDADLEIRRTGLVFVDELQKNGAAVYGDGDNSFHAAVRRGDFYIVGPTRRFSWRGRLFQSVTWFFSWYGWTVFLGAGWALGLVKRRSAADAGNIASPIAA